MGPMQSGSKFTDRIIKYLKKCAEWKTMRASPSKGHVISVTQACPWQVLWDLPECVCSGRPLSWEKSRRYQTLQRRISAKKDEERGGGGGGGGARLYKRSAMRTIWPPYITHTILCISPLCVINTQIWIKSGCSFAQAWWWEIFPVHVCLFNNNSVTDVLPSMLHFIQVCKSLIYEWSLEILKFSVENANLLSQYYGVILVARMS